MLGSAAEQIIPLRSDGKRSQGIGRPGGIPRSAKDPDLVFAWRGARRKDGRGGRRTPVRGTKENELDAQDRWKEGWGRGGGAGQREKDGVQAGAPWKQMRASFIGSVWLRCSLAVRDYETPKVPGTLTIRLLKDSPVVKVTY